MPKRSAQEKIDRYKNKIRKLENESNKQLKRKRVRRIIDSSDEDNIEALTSVDADEIEPDVDQRRSVDPQPILEPQEPQPGTSNTEQADNNDIPLPPEAVSLINVSLDPELLLALGVGASESPDFGKDIHMSLANLWPPILKKGLPKDDKEKLVKEYLIPGNCQLLQAPTLNVEISAAISDIVRGRDRSYAKIQQQIGSGISAVNIAMDAMLNGGDKIQLLKGLSDGCRILTDAHYALTQKRTQLITPSLEKNFLNVIQDTERDSTLFGSTLAEKIKASKAIDKQGSQIRKNPIKNNTYPARNPSYRNTYSGNWVTPRYSSNRGGRGGQRQQTFNLRFQRPHYPQRSQPQKSNPPPTRPRATPPH